MKALHGQYRIGELCAAYHVDPGDVNHGDPIDMAKRLDGTPTLRSPPGVS